MILTRTQSMVLAANLRYGRKEAAQLLGMAEHTARAHMSAVNERLGTLDKSQAAIAMGWTRIPPEYEAESVADPVSEKKPGDRRADTVRPAQGPDRSLRHRLGLDPRGLIR